MKKEKIEINVTINKETEIFNPYNKEQISDELSNYIYNQCKGSPINKNIKIKINHNFEIKENEKKEIIDAIRSNFGIDIKENILYLKYHFAIETILIIIGSIFIVASRLIDALNTILIDEIVSIFGCVMIWEVAYNIIFADIKILIQNKRLKRLTKSKINFNKTKTS